MDFSVALIAALIVSTLSGQPSAPRIRVGCNRGLVALTHKLVPPRFGGGIWIVRVVQMNSQQPGLRHIRRIEPSHGRLNGLVRPPFNAGGAIVGGESSVDTRTASSGVASRIGSL